MGFDDTIIIGLYVVVAFWFFYYLLKPKAKPEKVEELDMSDFIQKVQKVFDFHWRTIQVDANTEIEAYICGKTGYVFAKIIKQDPFYTAYLKGESIGDYVTMYNAKEAINHHINFVKIVK